MGQHQLAQRSNACIGAPDAYDDSKCLGTVCAGNSGLASLKAVENLHRLIDHLLIWLGGSARSRRGYHRHKGPAS
jgi:hypothetical protein